jgi:hypothetical protein
MNELKIMIYYLKRKLHKLVYVQNCNIYKKRGENNT